MREERERDMERLKSVDLRRRRVPRRTGSWREMRDMRDMRKKINTDLTFTLFLISFCSLSLSFIPMAFINEANLIFLGERTERRRGRGS
jgi:hypothetical protein